MRKNIYFYIGTTAEFIKLAPIIKEFRKRKIKFKIITSGQNKIGFKYLRSYSGEIKVYKAFSEKSHKSSFFLFGIWAIKTLTIGIVKLRKEFKDKNKNNSYFIIHGDTVSSLIGSIIAKLHGLKIVHIESGLRSFNFGEPFPEEISRFIIIHLADILFAPTDWALKNLNGLKGEKISTKQNTLIESCKWALKSKGNKMLIKKLGKYYILIMHRQEHVYFNKDWTRKTLDLVIKNANPNLKCLFIMLSLTSRFLESERLNADEELSKRIIMLPHQPYPDFMKLMNNAEFIATDGCTNQEEAYYMGLPLLSLRNLTERIEGLRKNTIISKGSKKTIKQFLKNYKKYRTKPVSYKNRPSKIIVDYLMTNQEKS